MEAFAFEMGYFLNQNIFFGYSVIPNQNKTSNIPTTQKICLNRSVLDYSYSYIAIYANFSASV